MALIALGLIGLVVRLVSAGSNELVLEGILPISPGVIDGVTITSQTSQASLKKIGNDWEIDGNAAFVPKLDALWTATVDIDGAQLVAQNPANHERIGVADGQGTSVVFSLGTFTQEEFIVGEWSQNVRLCYLRRPARDEVYAIPCPVTNIFDADPDGWRDPIVVSIPREAVEMIEFSYPGEEFVLRRVARGWTIDGGAGEEPADIFAVNAVLASIEVMVARSFAGPDETQGLDFAGPAGVSIRITSSPDSNIPVTRVRLLPRDDASLYARTPAQSTIFILDSASMGTLLLSYADFTSRN